MAMSKLLKMSCMLFAAMCISATSVVQAQVLPILNSFSNRTFNGTVDVSWPVLFDGCIFVTDSVVLRHSYGVTAVLRVKPEPCMWQIAVTVSFWRTVW